MARGLRMTEEDYVQWRANRVAEQMPKNAEFVATSNCTNENSGHMAGAKLKRPPSPELLAEIAAIQAIVAKPKRIAPVDRTVNAPKYRNQKVEVDGIKFDSKKEAKRWQELKLLEAAGEIANLQRQVRYTLIPAQKRDDGTTERKVEYVADFKYYDVESDSYIVEDVKGMKTPLYTLKRKLMLWVHGITIKEI